jgi:hypothetical protein
MIIAINYVETFLSVLIRRKQTELSLDYDAPLNAVASFSVHRQATMPSYFSCVFYKDVIGDRFSSVGDPWGRETDTSCSVAGQL